MNELQKIESFRQSLAIAETIEEIKLIGDAAAAYAELLRRQNVGYESQNKLGEFRVEVDAKKGEWLNKYYPHGGDEKHKISKLPNGKLRKMPVAPRESSDSRLLKAATDQQIKEAQEIIISRQQVIEPKKVATEVRAKAKKKAVNVAEAQYQEAIKEVSSFDVDIYNTDQKFNIILADPAWQYWEGGHKNQSLHYPTMSLEEIKALPVSTIAADNCILFLWVTFPILQQSFDVIQAWGFEYSTCGFVWLKKNKKADSWFFGNGSWTRANTELCLIATRGSVTRINASISQIVEAPVSEHSQKPNVIRRRITELVGALPRIELFSRNNDNDGWYNWGNKI
jgi:N6-adenosine-specific RNA methylase IME4